MLTHELLTILWGGHASITTRSTAISETYRSRLTYRTSNKEWWKGWQAIGAYCRVQVQVLRDIGASWSVASYGGPNKEKGERLRLRFYGDSYSTAECLAVFRCGLWPGTACQAGSFHPTASIH